jgi:hypothetical protein
MLLPIAAMYQEVLYATMARVSWVSYDPTCGSVPLDSTFTYTVADLIDARIVTVFKVAW